jgi:hypothetical protein
MKLFRLTKKEYPGRVYEEQYIQKIVLAERQDLARKIANENRYGDNDLAEWENLEEIICEEIILESSHAGFIGGVFIHCWS